MTKLKLGAIQDDEPIKITVKLPAALHRDLLSFADYLNSQHVLISQTGGEPCRV